MGPGEDVWASRANAAVTEDCLQVTLSWRNRSFGPDASSWVFTARSASPGPLPMVSTSSRAFMSKPAAMMSAMAWARTDAICLSASPVVIPSSTAITGLVVWG